MNDDFITVQVGLFATNPELDKLDLPNKQITTSYYPMQIRLSSISCFYRLPDGEGIPTDEWLRINVSGIEYTVFYSYNKLIDKLNINVAQVRV